jgi:hypothetical protein
MRNCNALRHRSAERVPSGSSRPHRTLEYWAGRRTDYQTQTAQTPDVWTCQSRSAAPAGVACRLITATQGQRGCAQSRRDGGRKSLAPSCPEARKNAPGRLALSAAMARWAPLSSLLPASSKVGESHEVGKSYTHPVGDFFPKRNGRVYTGVQGGMERKVGITYDIS